MTGLRTEFVIDPSAFLAFEQAGLTPREADSAASALAGLTAEEAARKMGISPSSVGNYRARAYRKLGVRNSRELVDRFGESRRAEAPQPQPRARLTALGLNESQVNVAVCILVGLSTREIAAKLNIAEGTVNSNRSRIYATLGVHSRDELAQLVTQPADSPKDGNSMARRILCAAALALICGALLFGGWHLTHTRAINGVSFSVNVAGKSYGNYDDAQIPDGVTGKSILGYCPDLIEVTASNGKQGYANAEEVIFDSTAPTPVYDATGLHIIGST